ncbi:MAG: YidC/Oxa1 family membrane protein insertase [Bacillota bacterium]|nr:YidC/Oxa1 family membrane protein insertase [Bacillota bacterium]
MSTIIGFFAKIIAYPMTFIYKFVDSYGLAIILLTVLIRALMIPLYAKQMKSTAKMAELSEKQKEIQVRYARDKEMMNQKLTELYQENGVSTYAGCLPLVIQLPVLMGLYELLRNPLKYMLNERIVALANCNMIAAVHESFLWVTDLSQADAWVFPLLAGITTYLTTAIGTASADNQAAGAMNAMKYFMPIMIFLLGRSLPAGLSLYWFIGNLVMVVQNLIFNKKKKEEKEKKAVEAEVQKRMKKAN